MNYYEMEVKGRILMDEVYKIIYDDRYDIKIYHTDPGGFDHYDSVVMRFNKDTTYIFDTHIFEVKIRTESYDTIMMEKSKYDNLNKIDRYDGIIKRYYVSCHPDGTYIFNISKIDKSKFEHRDCNISTVENKGKKDKMIFLLEKNEAKFLDIKSYEMDTIKKMRDTKIEKEIINNKQTKCLFDWLNGTYGKEE